jgi:hypothetical protein
VEVFPRRSYPGKKTDFITGNHEALRHARQAGYHLFVVGSMLQQDDESRIRYELKLIETQMGVTLWAGQIAVTSNALDTYRTWSKTGLVQETPSQLPFGRLTALFADCAAAALFRGGTGAPEQAS